VLILRIRHVLGKVLYQKDKSIIASEKVWNYLNKKIRNRMVIPLWHYTLKQAIHVLFTDKFKETQAGYMIRLLFRLCLAKVLPLYEKNILCASCTIVHF
jgi:hypothetical protein